MAEVAHVTSDSDTIFKVKRSKVKVTLNSALRCIKAALLSAALTHEAGTAVTVRTYWAWETTATLRLLCGARGAGAPTEEERSWAYRVATRTACYAPALNRRGH